MGVSKNHAPYRPQVVGLLLQRHPHPHIYTYLYPYLHHLQLYPHVYIHMYVYSYLYVLTTRYKGHQMYRDSSNRRGRPCLEFGASHLGRLQSHGPKAPEWHRPTCRQGSEHTEFCLIMSASFIYVGIYICIYFYAYRCTCIRFYMYRHIENVYDVAPYVPGKPVALDLRVNFSR